MAYKDDDVRRARDRERFRRRSAERKVMALCPRCGQRRPEPGRSLCAVCNEKQNAASRARDARLRTEGKPRRDPARSREYERARSRRIAAERIAAGLCTGCGKSQAEPERRLCGECGEHRRAAERERYAEARARGELYGGKPVGVKRKAAGAASRKRREARIAAGVCTRCGRHPPIEGGTECQSCRDIRRARERKQWAERRAAGECGKCGVTVAAGSRCEPCLERETSPRAKKAKNARTRKLYMSRRVRRLCTDCGAPSFGAARCAPCAKRSYEHSDHFRGIPVWNPTYTVVELATGREHGPFDGQADVALCLAFAKLSRDQVEVIRDAPSTAVFTAWT